MKGHAVERLAQSHGAGERGKKRCLRLGGEGQRHQTGGRADVAEEGKHLIVQQLAGVLHAASGFVAVVELTQLNLRLVHAAFRIELFEKQLGAGMELDAQLGGGPGEGGRLAQHHTVARLGSQGGRAQHRSARHQPTKCCLLYTF
ncbi:hypothetical protein D9M68_885070 [compost metagenome]